MPVRRKAVLFDGLSQSNVLDVNFEEAIEPGYVVKHDEQEPSEFVLK